MGGYAIKNRSHLYWYIPINDLFGDGGSTVGKRKYRLFEFFADFAFIDIESGNDVDIF